MKKTRAWAIEIEHCNKKAFAGVFFFVAVDAVPPCFDGMRTALWSSRNEARAAMRDSFAPGGYARKAYRPRVVRVEVGICALGQS